MAAWYSVDGRHDGKRFKVDNANADADEASVAKACAATEYARDGFPPFASETTFAIYATAKGRVRYRYRIAYELVPKFTATKV